MNNEQLFTLLYDTNIIIVLPALYLSAYISSIYVYIYVFYRFPEATASRLALFWFRINFWWMAGRLYMFI